MGTGQNEQLKTPAEADADLAAVADNPDAPAESGGEQTTDPVITGQQPTKRGSVDELGGKQGSRDR